ncbi:hypothetical protein [Morganella morganii]|uniref:hypothetical protein n=1 Tax=Morganella morganii TaxID=582 RepID=UPI0030FEB290
MAHNHNGGNLFALWLEFLYRQDYLQHRADGSYTALTNLPSDEKRPGILRSAK